MVPGTVLPTAAKLLQLLLHLFAAVTPVLLFFRPRIYEVYVLIIIAAPACRVEAV